MRSMSSGWGWASLTAGEVGQRAGSSDSGWAASAGEVWNQEGGHSQKEKLDKGRVLQSQDHDH